MDKRNKQEETEVCFDNIENKKKSKFRKIIGTISLIIFPIFSPFFWLVISHIIYLSPILNELGFLPLIATFILFFPIYCYIYGICIIKNKKRKIFSVYNSISITLSIFLSVYVLGRLEIYITIFFVLFFFACWCYFWTTMPTRIRFTKKKKNHPKRVKLSGV
jgi:hypothetical protein